MHATALTLSLNLLILQGLLGAFDTLYHHEWTEALPRRASARRELRLHAVRALLYGLLFASVGQLSLHGAWLAALAALIAVEVILTLMDFVEEDRSRQLPATERVLHTILAINGGAVFALYGFAVWPQWQDATALTAAGLGWRGDVLTLFAAGVALSGLRNALASFRKPAPAKQVEANPFSTLAPQSVLITGGTGFIGSKLAEQLLAAGHAVTILSRQRRAAIEQFQGRAHVVASLADIAAGQHIDTIVNLAGAPVVGPRWSSGRKAVLWGSRIGTTEKLHAWLSGRTQRPSLLINGSAIGFFGVRPPEEALDETAKPGKGYMSELCQGWEQAARNIEALGLRTVILRFGLVFGPSSGLQALLLPIRLGFGGRMGNGAQIMSWIHRDDVLAIMARAMADSTMAGIYNATAPEAPSQAQFVAAAGKALHRPIWFHLPATPLRWLMGEMAELFVDGQRVVPQRLLAEGYTFRYPTLASALAKEA
ncbi:TIGR01777 family oxidoreductase [Chitinimonas sp.]|uniref:TIGR01777 family oxidoreductase n=1 Tax=Chitinimonas sp. TaxID=1934313 RepID=UPI0035B315D2